jgi:hypothetical protein
MRLKLPERRRFVRVETPLRVDIECDGRSEKVITKNISPVGFRFEVEKKFDRTDMLEMRLHIPMDDTVIGLKGKVVWQEKVSLEDGAPIDVGMDIVYIEEKNKNFFLKYLCDLLYASTYQERT